MEVNKKSLLAVIEKNEHIPILSIHKLFGVDDRNEEDRRKVWKIGQMLAELLYRKWIKMTWKKGMRVYHANAF